MAQIDVLAGAPHTFVYQLADHGLAIQGNLGPAPAEGISIGLGAHHSMRQGKDILVPAVVRCAAGTEAGIVESDLSGARLADLAAIGSAFRSGTDVFLRFGLGNGSWGWSSRLRGNGLRLRLRSSNGRLRGDSLRLRLRSWSWSLGLGLRDISCFFRGIWDDWGYWLGNGWRLMYFWRRRLRLSCGRSRGRSRILGGRALLDLLLVFMGVKVGMLVLHVIVDLDVWRGEGRIHPNGGGNIDSLNDNIGNCVVDEDPLFKGHSRGERQDGCEDGDGDSFHFVGRGWRYGSMEGPGRLSLGLVECSEVR